MSEVTDLASAASSPDAKVGLRAALALRRLAERLEELQVANARRHGWSWQEIAEALEVSKQAVPGSFDRPDPGVFHSSRVAAGPGAVYGLDRWYGLLPDPAAQ